MKTMTLTERYGDFHTRWWVDKRDDFTTIWHTEPPPLNTWFTVLREDWSDDGTVRRIYEWKPVRR